MTIEDRNLKAGTKLVARYKGETYKCSVIDSPEGIRYQVLGQGKTAIHKSPSSAGSAIMGGSACNGWRFWSIEGQEPAPKTRGRKAKKTSEDGAKPATFENVAEPEEADGRFWCNCCADGFSAPAGVEPIGCPKGHTPAESAGCAGQEA